MAALNFFNPAQFLPSPDAAIKKPPVDNSFAFALGEGIKEVGKVSQKYFDIESLKREAESLADYTKDKSPQLAQFLREKAANYNIGTTDPVEERSNLFKGFIGMSKLEQDDRQNAMRANSDGQYQLYGAKLQAQQGMVSNLARLNNEWDQNEIAREKAHKEERIKLSARGTKTTDYQKRVNPYDSQLTEAQRVYERMITETPSTVRKNASPTSSYSVAGSATEDTAMLPDASQYAGNTEASSDLLTPPDLPDTPVVLPEAGTPAAPAPPSFDIGSTAPKTDLPPPSGFDVGSNPPTTTKLDPSNNSGGKTTVVKPQSTEVTPAPDQADPNLPNDPVNQEAQKVQELQKSSVGIVSANAKGMIDIINSKKDLFTDKKASERLAFAVNEAMKQINNISDKGSTEWREQAKDILAIVNRAITNEPQQTVTDNAKENSYDGAMVKDHFITQGANAGTVKYKIFKRQTSVGPVYYTINAYGNQSPNMSQQEYQSMFKAADASPWKPNSEEESNTATSKVNVMDPNIKIPMSFDRIRNATPK